MVELTYVGTASVWRTASRGGITARPGETVEVDDETTADWLTSEHDFVRGEPADVGVPPNLGVLTGSIADLESELDAGDHDDRLGALEREEQQHKNRAGALDAIADRREDIAKDESDDDSDSEE